MRYVVKLNEKSFVKGKGYILSTDLYEDPYYVHIEVTDDIDEATIFKKRKQAEKVVERYGGCILRIKLDTVL